MTIPADTLKTLRVASAFPDPPFDIEGKKGFDGELMEAICDYLNLNMQQIAFQGENFNDIFNGLGNDLYDVVISGTTITPERSEKVLFSNPYLEFNQGIAINTKITPSINNFSDLKGLAAGIQQGNTSDKVARKFLAEGIIKSINYYPYRRILDAIEDLNKGHIGLVIKLFPVLQSLTKDYSHLSVALQVPTSEKLGIAFAKNNTVLCEKVNNALDHLIENGTLLKLKSKWIDSLGTE